MGSCSFNEELECMENDLVIDEVLLENDEEYQFMKYDKRKTTATDEGVFTEFADDLDSIAYQEWQAMQHRVVGGEDDV